MFNLHRMPLSKKCFSLEQSCKNFKIVLILKFYSNKKIHYCRIKLPVFLTLKVINFLTLKPMKYFVVLGWCFRIAADKFRWILFDFSKARCPPLVLHNCLLMNQLLVLSYMRKCLLSTLTHSKGDRY